MAVLAAVTSVADALTAVTGSFRVQVRGRGSRERKVFTSKIEL
jgi:hypothetical protein